MLTLVSGILVPLLRREGGALRLVRGVAGLSALLLARLSGAGASFSYPMGHIPAPWGNELRAGPLEALLALTFSVVMLLSLSGGAEDLRRDVRPDRQGWYCLLMQLLFGALLAMVYTDDLFTGYVFVEIAAVTACVAVAAKESGRSVVAAIRYLIFSCLGSGLVLLGIAMLYCITGQLLFSGLEEAVARLVQSGEYSLPLVVSALLMTLGLSIKSAQFPFHAWLPDAHASATTASSAILSGLVLKGYLVLLLKLILRVFGPALIVSTYMDDLLFLLGLTGMLFASVAALRQEEVKRMIAYSSSAQISYIFLALGLGSEAGWTAACYQILAAGEMIRASGGHYWGELRGAARLAPLGGAAFTVGGLSLCGLPLLAGFSAKYCIAAAALDAEWQTAPALFGLAASSVLNAMYYIPAILAIWGRARANEDAPVVWMRGNWEGKCVILLFLSGNLLLGTAFGPIRGLIQQGLALF